MKQQKRQAMLAGQAPDRRQAEAGGNQLRIGTLQAREGQQHEARRVRRCRWPS